MLLVSISETNGERQFNRPFRGIRARLKVEKASANSVAIGQKPENNFSQRQPLSTVPSHTASFLHMHLLCREGLRKLVVIFHNSLLPNKVDQGPALRPRLPWTLLWLRQYLHEVAYGRKIHNNSIHHQEIFGSSRIQFSSRRSCPFCVILGYGVIIQTMRTFYPVAVSKSVNCGL